MCEHTSEYTSKHTSEYGAAWKGEGRRPGGQMSLGFLWQLK